MNINLGLYTEKGYWHMSIESQFYIIMMGAAR